MSTRRDSTSPNLTLYTYYRSSCSARLRIALHLKGLKFEPIFVDLKNGRHKDAAYVKVNPNITVPTLIVNGTKITQSIAALEYLEEIQPGLLPSSPMDRAHIRSLVQIIASDFQPVTNLRVLQHVGGRGMDGPEWFRHYGKLCLDAYENLIESSAGKYSFGDELTLADVCLAPAIWNAERYELDMGPYPTIRRVAGNLEEVDAVYRSHWKRQPDCPPELRNA